jgi:hypothetical protein
VVLEDTVPIVFNGGAYGTYLEWCLVTLTTDSEIVSPFTSVGSSHQFFGRHLSNMEGWNQYVTDEKNLSKFVRFHPKSKKEENIVDHLEVILSTVEKMICVYPDKNSVLLNINNWFNKVVGSWIPEVHTSNNAHQIEYIVDKIYRDWPVAKSIPLGEVPTWIQREFLSFYLMPAWYSQVEWYLPDQWSNEKCCFILINDLLFNFVETMNKIQKFCNLEFKKPIDSIIPFHDQNLFLQKYLGQDQLCQQIIQSLSNGIDFSWNKLPLASESWVQWQLRNQNFEIRCEGLDTFPTNSVQLKELLYTI